MVTAHAISMIIVLVNRLESANQFSLYHPLSRLVSIMEIVLAIKQETVLAKTWEHALFLPQWFL